MDFMEATDRLMACGVTLQEIADAFGLAHNTIRVTRLDPASPSYRRPPAGWPEVLVELAEGRSNELAELGAALRDLVEAR